MNLELVKTRSRIVRLIRRFFDEQGFLEMFTPRLVGLPGQEAHLEPFWTNVQEPFGASHGAALITSPEYAMKRLLASGCEKIYDLGPCFRNNESWDETHDPEFLLLEWYRREARLEDLMLDTESLINFLVTELSATDSQLVNLQKPFRRITVAQAMKQHAQVDLDALLEHPERFPDVVRAHGQTVAPGDTFDDLFYKIFLSEVEPRLGFDADRQTLMPTFLYYYPASMAALARRNPLDTRYALRTELYIGNLELANGFAELSDPIEQRQRFLEDRELRKKLGHRTWDFDERFLSSLSLMGSAAGIALGVDRLVMILTGATSINDILPFPASERFNPELERK